MIKLDSMKDYAAACGTGGCVAALGTFDGVHLGHAALIRKAVALARETGLPAVALTFDRHPMALTHPLDAPQALTDSAEKERLFAALGIDVMIVEPFTAEFAAQTPEAYLRALCACLKPAYIVIGFNHRFGKNGAGNAALLRSLSKDLGYGAVVMDPVCVDGEAVSSTRIRSLLDQGKRVQAEALAGHELPASK